MLNTPVIVYVGTTQKPTATFEVYLDGFRIGYVKTLIVDGQQVWRAVQWRHLLVGTFDTGKNAMKAVVNHYTAYRERCTPKQVRMLEKMAVRLTPEKERKRSDPGLWF